MVVQHNLTAMNSNRMLGLTTSAQAKSTEKLSSGYKINRAADDAAGLSISEKMRKQIRGLSQASLNAQDGISSVQTAEGALNEVQDMLQRMNELAVKASNGTMSENDRSYIQNEIDQLVTEIDRVAETTKFNETYLLKGDGSNTTKNLNAHDAGLKGTLEDLGNGISSFELEKALEKGDKVTIAGKEYTIGTSGAKDSTEGYDVSANVTTKKVNIGDSITVDDAGTKKTYTLVNKMTDTDLAALGKGSKFTIEDEYGNKTEYTIDTATDLDAVPPTVKAADIPGLVEKHLKNPDHKVTVTLLDDGTGKNKTADIEVVSALGTEEVAYTTSYGTSYDGKTVNDLYTAKGNGGTITSVTVAGETTTVTPSKPVSAADVNEVVKALKTGDTLYLTDDKGNSQTVKIGTESDPLKGEYSVEDVLNVIKDQYQVEFAVAATNQAAIDLLAEKGITNTTGGTSVAANKVTVIGNAAGNATGNVLSVEEAYEKMAEELQKASSIGADTEASVVNNGDGTFKITQGTVEVKNAITLNLHVGADADSTNKISIDVSAMSAAGLGVKGLDVTDTTGTSATYAIDAIADAIQQVSTQRSALGAIQNRLEHTINNLDNVVENTTSAESAIRDTDMASEMVKYSNNNILAQAGQSMLAQANQSNQGVLSLLG